MSRAWFIVVTATWDRSTSMPRRCISVTTSRPNADRPPQSGSSVAESAQPTLSLCVSVMYRTPSAYRERSTPSELLMQWPPSAPSSEAILPAANAASTSSARHRELEAARVGGDHPVHQVDLLEDRGHRRVAGQASTGRRPTRTGRRPRPPPGAVCRCGCRPRRPVRPAATGSSENFSRITQGRSLCPSISGKRLSIARVSDRDRAAPSAVTTGQG